MRGRVPLLLVVALVTISGCSALESGNSGEFSETVEFAWAGVAGDDVHVIVVVENTGDNTGEYEATLEADGEAVTTDSVDLESGETATLTLAHTFEEPGEYDLAVADEERTIQVYDSPETLFYETDFDVGTRIIAENATLEAELNRSGDVVSYSVEENTTIHKNFTAETQYEETESTNQFEDTTWEESSSVWIVNGTEYTKTTDPSINETTYTKEPSDEFTEGGPDYAADSVSQYLTTDHTADEYVYIYDVQDSADARTVIEALSQEEMEEIPPDAVSAMYLEFRVERALARPSSIRMDLSLEQFESFGSLEISIEQEVVSFGDAVDVEVPEEVRENATSAAADS